MPHSYYVDQAKANINRDIDKLLLNLFTGIYLNDMEVRNIAQDLIYRTKQHVNELSPLYKAKPEKRTD